MSRLIRFFTTGDDRPPLQDKEKVDALYRKYRWSTMLAITLGYGIAYTCRLGLSVVKKPLIDDGIFTAEQLGLIGSAIFYGYGFGKLVNGFLADHANVKRFMAIGILLSALVNIVIGQSTILWLWAILWGLNGWFQGYGSPAGVVALTQWFSNKERGRYYGVWSTAHSIGEGLTFAGSAGLVSLFGWRAGFWGPGVVCVLVAFVMYLTMQDRPQTLGLPSVADWKNDHGVKVNDEKQEKIRIGDAQKLIFRMPAIWILALASAIMYMSRYAINSWGILYLQEAKGYSLIEAGSILGLNTIAGIIGCLAYGFISDKVFKARRPPANLIWGALEVIALTIIFFGPSGNTLVMTLAFVLYGFSINGLVTGLGGLFGVDIAPKKAAGAVMGFVGVFSYIGAAVQERISGYLVGKGTTMIDGVRHYDFSKPVIFWLGTSVVSMLLAAILWKAKVHD